MDTREKLVDLLDDMQRSGTGYFGNAIENKKIADYLIAHGVTVQEYAYLETVVEVKDNTVCRSRVPNEVSQLTKKIVGLKNV